MIAENSGTSRVFGHCEESLIGHNLNKHTLSVDQPIHSNHNTSENHCFDNISQTRQFFNPLTRYHNKECDTSMSFKIYKPCHSHE